MLEKVSYRGWHNNLRISNGVAEVIVTLDVGPRLICYHVVDGFNVMKNYDEQMGGIGEAEWQIRGGLRFWLAPEDLTRTYYPDNHAVRHEELGPNKARFIPPPEKEYGVQKEMTVELEAGGTRVHISLKVTNIGPLLTELAPWGPTVMAPGGVEIIPQPPHRNHPLHPKNARSPADFAPSQEIILWPYFDFTDNRWSFGSRYILLRQDANKGPTKLGLAHREGWVGYWNQGALFVKRFGYIEGGAYPDMGTNYQTFSNEEMLEMETVGTLSKLMPGQSAELRETWELFTGVPKVENEQDIERHVVPLLRG